MQNRNKGITLIALIVTLAVIIVLLGVSINVFVNSDIIGHSEKTGQAYTNALENDKTIGNDGVTINGKRYANMEDFGRGEELIESNIPGGTKVDTNKEYTIEGGLVIYLINDKTEEDIAKIDWNDEATLKHLKETYDQFVWIPISHTKINDMFICQAKENPSDKCNITVKNGTATCTTHNSTQMAGRLYATDPGETYKDAITETYTPNSGLREPDVVTESNGTRHDADLTNLEYIATVTGDSTSYASIDEFKKTLQTEYNEIVKSIYNAEGFWVGRYETSNMTKNANTAVKVVAGTNTGINNVNWYYMYGQQKAYSANKNLSGVKSSMILGACHDQVLEFVNTENYNVKQAGNVGHTSSEFTTKPYLTGGIGYSENYSGTIAYNDVSRNVYDLEGNVYEWTTESFSLVSRVYRGRPLLRQRFS